ncbi:MAG: hypothetical protein HZB51_26175 [Chloroflexi bacterium]|nr:hypothetical protein [Chloroflexota bacterium]
MSKYYDGASGQQAIAMMAFMEAGRVWHEEFGKKKSQPKAQPRPVEQFRRRVILLLGGATVTTLMIALTHPF